MTHKREFGTIAEALTNVIEVLGGSAKVAKMLGVGRSTVDAWKNPERVSLPSIEQIVLLETNYCDVTKSPSPTPIILAMIYSVEQNAVSERELNLLEELLKSRAAIENLTSSLINRIRSENLGREADLNGTDTDMLVATCYDTVRILTKLAINFSANAKNVRSKKRYSLAPR